MADLLEMETDAAETAGAFSVGAVLSATASSFRRRWVYFMALAFVCYIPTYFASAFMVLNDVDAGDPGSSFLNSFLPMICNSVLAALAIYSVVMSADGQRPGFGRTWRAAAPRIGHVIGVSFLIGLMVGVGLILLVVPGVIAGVMFAVAVPVIVIERSGVGEAIRRSRALTKGRRWEIFGLLALYYIGAGVILFGVGYGVASEFGGDRGHALSEAAIAIANLVLAPLYAIGAAHAYLLLKREKEGIDARALANVFS